MIIAASPRRRRRASRSVMQARYPRRASARASVAPPARERLAIAIVAWAEDEHSEPARPRLERADDLGRDADRVERRDLEDVVVELHPAGARQHDVDLLGARILVP